MLPKQRRHKRLQGVPVLGGPRGLIDLLDLRRLGVHLPPQARPDVRAEVAVLDVDRRHAGAREAAKQGIARIGFVAEMWIDRLKR